MGTLARREDIERVDDFGIGAPNDEYAQYFKGNSYLKALTDPDDGNLKLSNVTFEPGCRNNWHIHHSKSGGGQVLICTAGEGWYQEEGKDAVSLSPGMVINIPPNVKHWHGAKSDSWFSHIAVEVPGDETTTEWLEEVDDSQYRRLRIHKQAIDEVKRMVKGDGEMGKIKIFIAQPMRHKSDAEIIEERYRIIARINNELFKGEEIEILNSYMEDFVDTTLKNKSLNYLGRSIQLLSEADCVYFGEGWREARGCHIEHECAERYGLKIIED